MRMASLTRETTLCNFRQSRARLFCFDSVWGQGLVERVWSKHTGEVGEEKDHGHEPSERVESCSLQLSCAASNGLPSL